jgi:hypothetical protein
MLAANPALAAEGQVYLSIRESGVIKLHEKSVPRKLATATTRSNSGKSRPAPSLHSLLPVNLPRKFRHYIQQRAITHLPQHRIPGIAKRTLVPWLPRRSH